MKRRWNWPIWVGFVVVLAGFVSYPLVFVNYPITRISRGPTCCCSPSGWRCWVSDWPARIDAARSIEAIFGPILGLLSLATIGFFSGASSSSRGNCPRRRAPRVGQAAPDFTLPDQDGKPWRWPS